MSGSTEVRVPIKKFKLPVRIRPEQGTELPVLEPVLALFRAKSLRVAKPQAALVRECSLTSWSDCVPIRLVPPPTVAVHHRELPGDLPPGARANRGKRKRESAQHREAVSGGLSSSSSDVSDFGHRAQGAGRKAGSDPDEFRH